MRPSRPRFARHLRMTTILNAIIGLRHGEERPRRSRAASRTTRGAKRNAFLPSLAAKPIDAAELTRWVRHAQPILQTAGGEKWLRSGNRRFGRIMSAACCVRRNCCERGWAASGVDPTFGLTGEGRCPSPPWVPACAGMTARVGAGERSVLRRGARKGKAGRLCRAPQQRQRSILMPSSPRRWGRGRRPLVPLAPCSRCRGNDE